MNLLKIRYFVEVAKCGSFSGAAAKLYTSQPNISKQIAQMEQELDFPLFIREKRAIRLTAAGAFLYEKLKDVPDHLEALFEQTAALAGNPLSRLESLDMTQLMEEDFVVISPEESPVGYDRFIIQCQETGFTPRIVRQPRNLETLILCVEMGVGVALLDQHTRLAYNNTVRTIPISGKDMYVVAAYRKNDYRPFLHHVLKSLEHVE